MKNPYPAIGSRWHVQPADHRSPGAIYEVVAVSATDGIRLRICNAKEAGVPTGTEFDVDPEWFAVRLGWDGAGRITEIKS